jgi:hypothetical protein
MSIRETNVSREMSAAARKADNITAICEPIFQTMWDPQHLTNPYASMSYYRG